MGLLGAIFSGVARLSYSFSIGKINKLAKKSSNPSHKSSKGGAGYGAWTFQNIMDAHCSPEDLVDEFELDEEGCGYDIPWFGQTAYDQAYEEALALAEELADEYNDALDDDVFDAEDFLEEEAILQRSYEYACEYAEILFDGNYWVDEDFLEWAYYDVSDHNY